MEKIYFLSYAFAYMLVHTSEARTGDACSPIGSTSKCVTNEHCCPTSNGKSYCNPDTKLCEALRYCDEKSSKGCPFNDLSAKEIENVIKIVKTSKSFIGSELNFPIVRQQEPKKKLWNSGNRGAKERIAYAAVYDMERNFLTEVLVSLDSKSIISKKVRKDSIPPMTTYEYSTAEEVLRRDPRVIRAYQRRGLNISEAAFDIWAFGAQKDGNVPGRRRVKLVANYQDPGTKIMDWRPVEGISTIVDIGYKRIVDFSDRGIVTLPQSPCVALKDNIITPPPKNVQPSESSIDINGFQIKWENWKFQYSMDPVYGLQLYHMRYVADGEERFLIYKLSISEMFVPYGAEGKTWTWRGAFDAGEYGLGKTAAPLVLGKDVPSNAKLLSCPKLDDLTGEVTELENCIAVYERDASPIYTHYNSDTNADEGIPGRELVLTILCAIGNYDYLFNFILTIDGNIEVRVFATGVLLARSLVKEKNDPNCIEDCHDYINEHTIAPVHQHFFNYRIDFDIDGVNNMLTEVDFTKDPISPQNPYGGAFSLRRTVIREETFREFSAPNARYWSAINPQSRNRFNTPRGYSLHPGSIGSTFFSPGSPLSQAMFIAHPIWVSAYDDDEQGAAGTFPRSCIANQGLPTYIKNRESLVNKDLVVWHTFAITHAPRPEEFPFMNKVGFGFHIISRNFQSANPNVAQCKKNDLQ